jgi:Tol biopolymer transport system component
MLASIFLAGCSAAVREDRAIQFAPDGRQAAFQHGRDGIFLVETEGAEPTKIFQPDADTIAVSAPLFSPTDKRLIFTTAKSADKAAKVRDGLPAEADPAGDWQFAQATLYTCWLRTEPKPGQPLNVPLFTVPCGHPGYVAANLAVRWHPDGRHILYVKQDDQGRYGLHELDLQTETSRSAFPHSGSDLVFDWSPDKTHLVCVVSDKQTTSTIAGIWIGKPGADDWWHVPDSAELGRGDLQDLRAARPAWTADGSRFAFVGKREGKDKQPPTYTLHLGTRETHKVRTMSSGDKAIRDLHWRADGLCLGYLRGDETGVVHLADADDKPERVLDDKNVCDFLGWDASGKQLAFVVRQPLPRDPAKSWAFLLLPDIRARNAVRVASDAEEKQTKTIFSGLQVTFPQWSPTEAKLSMWATFRPAYRSWLSHLLDLNADENDPLRGLSLRPGDPALVLDPVSGERSWKAINAHEKTQIGHYHLLHREYADAWRWYELAAVQQPADASPQRFVQRFVRGGDALFFQAYCLDKLGRTDEARSKRRQFDESFLPELPQAANAPAGNQPAPFGAASLQPSKEQLRHWRDLYIAEVFLSVDAAEDGERFFRAEFKSATTDAERLSKALVLSQFLLLRKQYAEYADLASDTILPLLLRAWKPRNQSANRQEPANLILAYSDGLSLLPLFSPVFLAELSDKQVSALLPRWHKQQAAADDAVKRLGIDLFLQAAAHRLQQTKDEQAAASRLAVNPARTEILGDKDIAGFIEDMRGAAEFFEKVRQMTAMLR